MTATLLAATMTSSDLSVVVIVAQRGDPLYSP